MFADFGLCFFKQKTAYEMRISDWSSECALPICIYIIGKDVNIMDRAPKAWLTGVSWNWGPMMIDLVKQIQAGTWKPSHVRGNHIGRASCRERVCQSV